MPHVVAHATKYPFAYQAGYNSSNHTDQQQPAGIDHCRQSQSYQQSHEYRMRQGGWVARAYQAGHGQVHRHASQHRGGQDNWNSPAEKSCADHHHQPQSSDVGP